MNKIKQLVFYNFKSLNYRIAGVFSLIFILMLFALTHNYNELNINMFKKNVWDLYSFVYLDNGTLITALVFFSIYFTFNSFPSKREDLLKIRINNYCILFRAKVISVFLFNIIISVLSTLIVVLIGTIIMGYGMNWSEAADIKPYTHFYSPFKMIIYNIITFSFFITLFDEILLLLAKKSKNNKLIAMFSIIYIVLDKYIYFINVKIVNILKFISLNSYVNYVYRKYYKDLGGQFMTIKEGVIIPIILLIMINIIYHIYTKLKKGVIE